MSVSNIGDLLGKYKKMAPHETIVLDTTKTIIYETLNIPLETNMIRYSLKGVVYLEVIPVIRVEIINNKDLLIQKINKRLPNGILISSIQ